MAKIINLENARQSLKLFYVYYQNNIYTAVDVSKKKTKNDRIALLPIPTPNFVQQTARNKEEAIALVKQFQAESLLSSPL
ncbi:hypothetical protein G7B40_001660 [Aetokthonos hydrillicola Thurmond2011]|jgi:hypothetical protein|uniref:Uncharacterized protein n=1 Tax=Aetokthonos hydrillicola Thurmond2011 TaxID=2712845 RepID=A0AAP5I563_9CYAN|nr:hypothetical protein [Aetokthonos hydrillicola]MBO3462971.1 hypothetical protein [Aetokthonos hydrillicola CCALA 1050]MBW4591267.1 hypothetical protein [Aetokthonos hydrillicola CCALA 1050]MDR9893293.1 hypothetical protein [Aetokthonos hydrillicola Thurmond2011]